MSEFSKENFIKLYDEYHVGIYRFLRVKVANEEIAQDITSDTFLRGWEYLSKNPDKYPENPRAYLYRTAHNCLVNYYRKNKKEVPMEENIIEFLDKKQKNAIITDVSGKSDIVEMERIYKAIKGLSEDNTELITLKYIEDLSNSEIAEVLDKNEGAVRTALSRAIQELRRSLTPPEGSEPA